MTSTHTAKRALFLANAVGEFDPGDGDGRICEQLESCHGCASPLDRAMVLLDEVRSARRFVKSPASVIFRGIDYDQLHIAAIFRHR